MSTGLGFRIRQERQRIGLSQMQLARLLVPGAVGAAWVSKWELGKSTPNAASMQALSELGFDITYIITGRRALDRTSLVG